MGCAVRKAIRRKDRHSDTVILALCYKSAQKIVVSSGKCKHDFIDFPCVKHAVEITDRSQDLLFQYRMEEIDFAEPSEVHPEEEIVRTGVEAFQEATGIKPSLRAFSGFTDSRFYINQCHIPTLILGPGETDQSHTIDESVELDALAQASDIYALILLKFLSTESTPIFEQE